ncbi:AMP-binding enzyme, partial [Staphylococcus epidermidis]|uniref:AMP-binding enzyme n=1 Tax=Staphylococcus epidermidis TaxID=1282 RepID=UPI001352DFC1
ELQQFVKNEVAPYKYPREIEFVDDLPKTNSGKIRRVELRAAEIETWQQQKDSNQ